MMNDTFNLKRFSLLLKKSILERPAQIIGLMCLILCFTFILYAGLLYIGGWNPAQNLSFIWGFIGGGVMLSSTVFGYFNSNASGAGYITLPASVLEKWLCGVLITGVFFCIIFFGFYRIVDACFVAAYHNNLDSSSPLYKTLYNQVHIFSFDGNILRQSALMFVNFTGAMLLGSLYFNRVALVKVALIVCGVAGFFYFLNLGITMLLFNNVDMAFPFYNVLLHVGSENGNVQLPTFASNLSDITFLYILPVILWVTAYVRLKEKEI